MCAAPSWRGLCSYVDCLLAPVVGLDNEEQRPMKQPLIFAVTATGVLLLWAARLDTPPLSPTGAVRPIAGQVRHSALGDRRTVALAAGTPAAALRMAKGALPGDEPLTVPVSSRQFGLVGATGTELVERSARQTQPARPRRRLLSRRAERAERYVPPHVLPVTIGTTYRMPRTATQPNLL